MQRLLLGLARRRRCAGAPGRATTRRSRRPRRVPCSSAIANACFRRAIASSGLPSRNSSPPRLLSSRPTFDPVGELLVLRLRPLGVGSREHPVPVALGDRATPGSTPSPSARASSIDSRELERALDVVARRLVVALPAVAARAPREDVAPEQIDGQRRALGQRRAPRRTARSRSRCSRACSGRRPSRNSTSARSRSVNYGAFDERARLLEQVDRRAHVAALRPRPCLAGQHAHLQVDRAGARRPRASAFVNSSIASS